MSLKMTLMKTEYCEPTVIRHTYVSKVRDSTGHPLSVSVFSFLPGFRVLSFLFVCSRTSFLCTVFLLRSTRQCCEMMVGSSG